MSEDRGATLRDERGPWSSSSERGDRAAKAEGPPARLERCQGILGPIQHA